MHIEECSGLLIQALPDLPLLFEEPAAQCVMARDKDLAGALQSWHVQIAAQGQQLRNVVSRCSRIELLHEPHPLLGMGQCTWRLHDFGCKRWCNSLGH
ncbi:hypothetical protein D3C78_1506140 [compost metagenome]